MNDLEIKENSLNLCLDSIKIKLVKKISYSDELNLFSEILSRQVKSNIQWYKFHKKFLKRLKWTFRKTKIN